MATKIELLQKTHKRGILPADKMVLFEEAQRRSLIDNGQQKLPQEKSLTPQKEEKSLLRQIVTAPSDLAIGTRKGLHNAAKGMFQTAVDVGESLSKYVEKRQYGDNLNNDTFSDKLARKLRISQFYFLMKEIDPKRVRE